jgi:hypothetical protein
MLVAARTFAGRLADTTLTSLRLREEQRVDEGIADDRDRDDDINAQGHDPSAQFAARERHPAKIAVDMWWQAEAVSAAFGNGDLATLLPVLARAGTYLRRCLIIEAAL